MKKYILPILSLLLLVGCERSKGFTLKKITSQYAPIVKWNTIDVPSKVELKAMLNQPFFYLGSGNHTYAFVSSDGLYVIKFFKQKHMRTQSYFLSKEKILRRTQEREESFASYKIAYEQLKEETGLLYLHLNKTSRLGITLTLIDQHENHIKVNLDKIEFLIQKKGILAFEHLGHLIDEKAYEEALSAIISLLGVVAKRNQMGIYDKDLQFFKNFGFIENQAIEIDIGEFKLNKKVPKVSSELRTLSYQIRDFVREKSPEFESAVEITINKEIDKYK